MDETVAQRSVGKMKESIVFACLPFLFTSAISAKMVNESERELPVLYDVDIVVVGGTSGGVTAAVEAARQGASVFLAAQRPYLGEDLCGTYRLWLEPGEEPVTLLAKKMFAEQKLAPRIGEGIPFTYEANRPSAGVHKDTQPPRMLSDGLWRSASSESVQYDGDVAIIADLGSLHSLEKVHLMVYQREMDFEVEDVTIFVSNDKEQWKQVAVIKNDKLQQGDFETPAFPLSATVKEKARYIRLFVKKTERVERILLGEIIVEGEKKAQTADSPDEIAMVTPMQIKRTLDEVLLESGVKFLFGCYGTDVLRDEQGNLAGIVMANRTGSQAVKAKVIIDATPRASIARIAGAKFNPYPGGLQTFSRIVIGGCVRDGEGVQLKQRDRQLVVMSRGQIYPAIEYNLSIPMKDGSFASFAEAEQIARDLTWTPEQVDSSEMLFQIPPDLMKGRKSVPGECPGAAEIDLDAFRPADTERLYVLGGCADISRNAAAKMLRPLSFMDVGSRIGEMAAKEAKGLPKPEGVRVTGKKAEYAIDGEVREVPVEANPRLSEFLKIPAGEKAIPVIGEYDVVVVGGGTSGAPAGIGAARQNAKTLVIEYLHGLGGVSTLGFIGRYYHGYREGFTQEIDAAIKNMGESGADGSGSWNLEWKMEWYRKELRKVKADIWFGTMGSAALVDDGQVKGVVVATPEGPGVVLAKTVVDSTGNAAIAAAAGAPCTYMGSEHVAVQGTGLPPRELGDRYNNTDYTFVDDADIVDMWRAFVMGREKFKHAYDLGQLIDTRERRQIIGDMVLSPLDIWNHRRYPDTVSIHRSNFDSHGFTIHPIFMIKPPDRKAIDAHVAYRCLLPKGLDGILVTGLAVSAHRDAIPVIRMQPCVQNQGYAAGVAAAMSARAHSPIRDIDMRRLQRHLVEIGNLPESVLTDKDSFPIPKEKIAEAVKNVVHNYDELEVILVQLDDSLPLLRGVHTSAETEEAKLVYAHILCMLGDPIGADTLAKTIRQREWDEGWRYTGMGQFGLSMSSLDSLIVALGRTRDKRGLETILEKVEQLDADSEFSHFRAVAMALGTLNDQSAAKPLAELLKKPGMMGHAYLDIERIKREAPANSNDTTTRNSSLSELVLARALYRCGDYEGLGEKILRQYMRDLRGHYSRHAYAILEEVWSETK